MKRMRIGELPARQDVTYVYVWAPLKKVDFVFRQGGVLREGRVYTLVHEHFEQNSNAA